MHFMQGRVHNLAALVLCCCLGLAAGCAQTAESFTGFVTKPFRPKSPDELLHIKTPDDRRKELHQIAKSIGNQSPSDQERMARELGAEIRNESDPLMRRAILRALTGCQAPLAVAVQVAGTKDSDAEVRRIACKCLGERGGSEAVQELTRVANSDTETDVRLAAIRALGHTGNTAAMPVLAEALADANPAIQYLAKESLRSVSGRDYGDNLDAWREYAQTGKSSAPEISVAERVKRYFSY
jgi:hypothetical protein